MTSLATAVGGMKHWDWCPICRGGLDTGLECDQCGADLMPIYKAFKDLQARPTDSAVLRGIKARADRSRLGYGGKAWVTSDPKSEVVEDRMILIEIVGRQEFAINRLRAALNEAADSFKNAGLSVDAEDCEQAINESLSGGNPGEPKACTPAEERGIVGATGAGQLPDDKPESTVGSAERRSPDDTTGPSSPDESNRHFDRGCFVIMELMQAYERRVRSDCTPVEIDKRPWECAEYLKASEYLRKVWPPPEPPQPAEATECRYCDEVMKERDDYHEWADTLAYDIERLVGVEIGEHSNLNSPWGNAHDAAEYELDKRARKPHEPEGWRPIETAPADTDVLLYCPDRHYTNPERVELGQAKNTKGGSAHSWATHWMPVPSAPSTKEKAL